MKCDGTYIFTARAGSCLKLPTRTIVRAHCYKSSCFLLQLSSDLETKYDIDFASPKGPNPEVDEWSVEQYPADRGFLEDPKVKTLLETCKFISDVRASDYDAIFYVGGQGPVLDLASDPINAQLAAEVRAPDFRPD